MPASPSQRRPRPWWIKRVGWSMVVVGLVFFLLGNVGARTGWVVFSFDPHHLITQFGGAAVAIVGFILAL